ncbi:MAG: hypothetical protein HYY84_20720, partial [Deltaproteobacteria bacterium]|nr:hypothetical protein [Deltaproteobacteria bacterium]
MTRRALPRSPLTREIVALLASWRIRAWFVVLVAYSVLLLNLPLFNVLGFEFALASTIPLTFAAGHLGTTAIDLARRHHTDWPRESGARIAARRFTASLVVLMLFLFVPVVAGLIGAAFILNCNLARGLALYALLPLPGALLALATGQFVGALIPRRVWPTIAFIAIVLATAVWALFTFVTEPTIALYHPFVGYYPGSLYDERIESSPALLIYRATTIALALGLSLLVIAAFDAEKLRLRVAAARSRPLLSGVAVFILIAVGVVLSFGGRIGFSVTRRDIERELSARHETERVTIHYAPSADTARDIVRIATEHDFQIAEIERRLGLKYPRRIHSYIYPNADTKARLMGARNTYIAKPWLREIHIQHQPFPHPVLRHELVHVVAGELAAPPFHVSQSGLLTFNIGLIEGIAVAVDWQDDRLTPHHAAAAIHRLPGR